MTIILAGIVVYALAFVASLDFAHPVHRKLLDGAYMSELPTPAEFWAVSAATPLILLWEGFKRIAKTITP